MLFSMTVVLIINCLLNHQESNRDDSCVRRRQSREERFHVQSRTSARSDGILQRHYERSKSRGNRHFRKDNLIMNLVGVEFRSCCSLLFKVHCDISIFEWLMAWMIDHDRDRKKSLRNEDDEEENEAEEKEEKNEEEEKINEDGDDEDKSKIFMKVSTVNRFDDLCLSVVTLRWCCYCRLSFRRRTPCPSWCPLPSSKWRIWSTKRSTTFTPI